MNLNDARSKYGINSIVNNNKEFLIWYKVKVEKGMYTASLNDIEKMIKKIINYYECVYEDDELENYVDKPSDYQDFSDIINIEEIKLMLNDSQLELLESYEFRRKLFDLVTYSLTFSNNTEYYLGYFRSKIFYYDIVTYYNMEINLPNLNSIKSEKYVQLTNIEEMKLTRIKENINKMLKK